jgi:ABC-type maltose transport system permease subunit
MRKSKKTAGDIIKEILSHIILICIALIVLVPIFYLISAGFRTNQAIYGPLIDTNSWVDESIAVKSENKIKQDVLLNRLMILIDGVEAGKDADQLKADEEKSIADKRKPNYEASKAEARVLKDKAKKWILSKSKDDTTDAYKDFKAAYDNWTATLSEDQKEVADSQLFEDGDYSKLRYKYEIRTSFYNFGCFFTGSIPNAPNAKFPYLLWVWNSIIISLSVAVIQLMVVALASYAISRFRFKGKKASLMVILTVQVFPGTMAMVALYLLLQYLGGLVPALGIDRKIGLILIYLGGGIPFNIWLVKGYFDTIPKALEESAMIDGATYWQAFTMIIMPLVRPILAVVTILSFVGQYNEFVLASVILTSQSNFTLPVGLRFFMNAQQDARFGVFAACSIMGSLPIVILWLALQNQIISGLTGGSVKG